MTNKYFTLVYGDQIRTAPGRKIIPAEALSTMQDAFEVLGRVQDDARNYRLQVAKEAEELKENAFKEGYREGYAEWAEQLPGFENQIRTMHEDFKKIVIPIALMAAKKIVGREIELSEDVIVDIVLSNLKSVKQHKKIIIYVNDKDLQILEKGRPRLQEVFESLESLSIRSRSDIAKGDCVIETEIGIVDAKQEHRWLIIEKAFEKNLMNMLPETLKES